MYNSEKNYVYGGNDGDYLIMEVIIWDTSSSNYKNCCKYSLCDQLKATQ